MKSVGDNKWTLLSGTALGAASLGAAIMYAFDPDRGRARRAVARDKTVSAMNKARDRLDATGRDIGNRLNGLQARAKNLVGRRGASDSETMAGQSDTGMTSAAGSMSDRNTRSAQQTWKPAARVAAGTAGGMLLLSGLGMRRGPLGVAMSLLGAGLATRAIANRQLTQLVGMRAGSKGALEIEKSIQIAAPPERVFELWENYENFPRFMSHVREVRDLGSGRSHWVVDGPAGATVEFDSTITERERPRLLAWTSEPGATVDNQGMVRIEGSAGGGTRVTVRMSYRPPAGAVGQAVSEMLGSDPKRQMEEDLMRMKAFIETGAPPRDASMSSPREVQSSSDLPPPMLHS